jgi:Ca2+-binding EF-hand superfamily protein
MRSLFEYLDTNHDGRITQQCLLQGLNRLNSLKLINDESTAPEDQDKEDALSASYCEYEINELIRCVPDGDSQAGITLQQFLEAESSLLPKLTKLRLL